MALRAPTRDTNLNSVRVDGYVLKCPKKFAKRVTGQTFFGISSRFDLAHKSFKYVPRVRRGVPLGNDNV
jgi:hypothetical protein